MGFFQNLTGWHALILLAVVLLLFGATKLPALARSMGQSMRIFRAEVRDPDAHETDAVVADAPTAAVASTAAAAGGATVAGTPSPREVVPLAERTASS